MLYLRHIRASHENTAKNQPREGGSKCESEEAKEEEETVDHQSPSSTDLVIDEACERGVDKVGEHPDTRHPTVLLLGEREVGTGKVEVEVKEVRIGAGVEILRILLPQTVQNT